MKRKAGVVVGVGFLFIVIIALAVALWPSSKLILDSEKVNLQWQDDKTLFIECFARNDTDKDWAGMVNIQIDNLEGKTLWNGTADSWKKRLNKKVESGEGAWVSTMIPFSRIKGRYTEDTIIVRFLWGGQRVEKKFKL